MTLIKSKQVKRMFLSYIRINAISATGGSTVVTTPLTTAASSAGDLSASVPLQVSTYNSTTQTEGYVATTTDNKVEIYRNSDKKKIEDTSGNEVYGRLTESGGVYTVTYYSLVSGVETAYSFSGATSVDMEVPYNFEFHHLPRNFAIAIQARNVDEDSDSGNGRFVMEATTPTGTNTLPDLAKTPIVGTLRAFVNGQHIDTLSGSGFTHTGKVLTWTAATVGFSVETADRVVVEYQSFD